MCIVIDTNTLAMVFDETNERHAEFRPVKDWIDARLGFLIFGGTGYKNELLIAKKYSKIIRLLRDAGKAISISDAAVDRIEEEVKKMTAGSQCDDPHIIALLGASKCSLLCSVDLRSFDFIKDRQLYPKGSPRVRIYTSTRNSSLLKKSDPKKLKNVENNTE